MDQTYQPVAARITSVSLVTRGMVAGVHFVLAFVLAASLLVVLRPQVPSAFVLSNATAVVAAVLASAISSFVIALGVLRWQNWIRPLAFTWHSLNLVAVFVSGVRQQVIFEDLIRISISAFVIWWLLVPSVKNRFQNGGSKEK
ncbi:MAG TPA: hypothetical protein VN025_18495 [Candidatus Dormibacteraeota bacterium]|jgi:hypothetical protein|nr:hypothetical protein [Candidatus Dormibacteraeota bacterium]